MKPCQEPSIVFFGTSEFGAVVLERLINSPYKPALVVTAPDKPSGRNLLLTPPPVKISAKRHNIPMLQPEILTNHISDITHHKPDLFIVAAYGGILPKELLDIPSRGALNVHPSLLPKHRGSSPIQYAILKGDDYTGTTIMLMDEKIDHGPILAQESLPIPVDSMRYSELHDALAALGARLLVETIPRWIRGDIKAVAQKHEQATFTKRIFKEDGKIDWTKSARDIERQIRAFERWPESSTKIKSQSAPEGGTKILKILKARVLQQAADEPPGALGNVAKLSDGTIAVQTGSGRLAIKEVQLEGKKPMSAKDFLLGHPNLPGSSFY